ncbi:MAG: hypothetical protein RL757_2152 [Bacteroidota bacterium]
MKITNKYQNPTPILSVGHVRWLGIWALLFSLLFAEKLNAQACGSCATPSCAAVKQYVNKTTAQGGAGKIWQNYTPNLPPSTGSFTVYTTIRTDVNGQVAVMQELQVFGPTTGLTPNIVSAASSRTYKLFEMSNASCAGAGIAPNIPNDGLSTTFNPGWTNLLPNTDYKLALTTNLSGMASGYVYQGFNIRYYHSVRAMGAFTFNCGTSSYTGTFTANATGGQTGVLNVPISGVSAGIANLSVSGAGFSGSVSTIIAVGQTSIAVPITYDGSGAAGAHSVTVTSTQGSGSCSKNITVLPVYATCQFVCTGATAATGTFTANATGGQSGSLVIPITSVTAGLANFTASGGGFSGVFTGSLTSGQTSVTIPLTFDGSGSAGSRTLSITSPQETGSCAARAAVAAPGASFAFNCGSAAVSGNFVANGATGQGGFLTVPISGATAGTVGFTVAGGGFSGSLSATLVANQTSVTIPLTFDGSGAAGSRAMTVTSSAATGSCTPSATVTAPNAAGAITFACAATATSVGTFTANGAAGQNGLLTVNFTTQTAGQVTFSVTGGGFSGSMTANVAAGQTSVNVPVVFDGSGAAGNHAIAVASSAATGTCAMNVLVNEIFDFACPNFNTASNFLSNGQTQNGNLVIPIQNTGSGAATFAVTGGGFTGTLTTNLLDSQRYVSIPVVFDGSGAAGNRAVTVTSAQGGGTCGVNVWINNPAMQGCDFLTTEDIDIKIHSQNGNAGFSTHYVLVDANNVIRYSVAAMPFSGIAKGVYTAYAVNYSGTAPNLTVGTNLNAIGGSCVALSNAYPLKVCPAFTFSCGDANYTGTFVANGIAGQTGVLNVVLKNPLPVATTLTASGAGFSGSRTLVLTANDTIVPFTLTYDGSGSGGTILLNVAAANGESNCSISVIVLPPPPPAQFTFDCSASAVDATFYATGGPQSGSVAVNLTGVVAGTVDFTVIGSSGFSGTMDNVSLTNAMNSLVIPISFDGSSPAGTRTITISSPSATNTCSFTTNVLAVCATPSVGGTVNYTGGGLCSTANSGSVSLSGETGAVVKWQTSINAGANWTDIVNTATTFAFTNAANGQQYRAIVNGGAGCLDANATAATLTTSAAACATGCNVPKPSVNH